MNFPQPARLAPNSRLMRAWATLNALAFAVLAIRFLAAALADPVTRWPVAILAIGAAGLGAWNRGAALLAFTASVPLLNGLAQTSILPLPSPLLLTFAALWLGGTAGQFLGRPAAPAAAPSPAGLLLGNLLISSVLLSLALQLSRHAADPDFWTVIRGQPVQSYSAPSYFLTSAMVWLQGLFYFRCLLVSGLPPVRWLPGLAAAWAGTMALFCAIEQRYHLPEVWAYGFQSPFEDIASFGGVAATLFAFMLASAAGGQPGRNAVLLLGALALLGLVVGSYSRTAWVAAGLAAGLVASVRLPRAIVVAALITGGLALGAINRTADHDFWRRQPLLLRLVTLARFESLAQKDPSRVEFALRAARMIAERPLLGHGIGSFFATARRYSAPGDTYAQVNDFAHNAYLQFAAEQGLPALFVLIGLLGIALGCGLRASMRSRCAAAGSFPGTLALAIYLLMLLTGNPLNIYVSNQHFLWLLVAVPLSPRLPAEKAT